MKWVSTNVIVRCAATRSVTAVRESPSKESLRFHLQSDHSVPKSLKHAFDLGKTVDWAVREGCIPGIVLREFPTRRLRESLDFPFLRNRPLSFTTSIGNRDGPFRDQLPGISVIRPNEKYTSEPAIADPCPEKRHTSVLIQSAEHHSEINNALARQWQLSGTRLIMNPLVHDSMPTYDYCFMASLVTRCVRARAAALLSHYSKPPE
jgi:hypothetical protein